MDRLHSIWDKLRSFLLPRGTAQKEFGVETALSRKMEDSINLWYSMLYNCPPWVKGNVVSLGIAGAVCRELARPALAEMKATITGGARADYLQEQFDAAQEHFLRDLELGLALGGIAFKPFPFGGRLLVDATSAAGFLPTRFDSAGMCIGGVFRDKPVQVESKYYVRLEHHDLQNGTYTIRNQAYRSDASGTLAERVELTAVPEWADIQPEVTIEGVEMPLFAYYKNPMANNVDVQSPAGVSVYSGSACELIRQADEQWADIEWEYRSGQRKIFSDGTAELWSFDKQLFRVAPFTSTGDLFHEFSPAFRDDALYRGFQNILKQIEYQTGLSFGTISDPQTVDKTATEIRSSKQRMYVTVDSVQKALTHTFNTLIYAMDVYATLYKLAPAGAYEVAFDWGDSVLDDEETKIARNNDMRLDVKAGLLRPEIYVAKKYGVTEEDALAMMPDMNAMTTEEQDLIE